MDAELQRLLYGEEDELDGDAAATRAGTPDRDYGASSTSCSSDQSDCDSDWASDCGSDVSDSAAAGGGPAHRGAAGNPGSLHAAFPHGFVSGIVLSGTAGGADEDQNGAGAHDGGGSPAAGRPWSPVVAARRCCPLLQHVVRVLLLVQSRLEASEISHPLWLPVELWLTCVAPFLNDHDFVGLAWAADVLADGANAGASAQTGHNAADHHHHHHHHNNNNHHPAATHAHGREGDGLPLELELEHGAGGGTAAAGHGISSASRSSALHARVRLLLESRDALVATAGARTCRSLLADDNDAAAHRVLLSPAGGALPKLLARLLRDSGGAAMPCMLCRRKLVCETLSALRSAGRRCSGAGEMAALEAEAVPAMAKLLADRDAEVALDTLRALGAMAAERAALRDAILSAGAAGPLLGLADRACAPQHARLRRAWARVVASLCRGRPPPDFHLVSPFLPSLAGLLHTSADDDVIADAACGLSYLALGEDFKIARVVQTGVAPRLVQLLARAAVGWNKAGQDQHRRCRVAPQHDPPAKPVAPVAPTAPWLHSVMRTVGSIATSGDESVVQILVDAGCLRTFALLLRAHGLRDVHKDAFRALANIAAGSTPQVKAVVRSGVVPEVIRQARCGLPDVRKEAVFVLTNLILGGAPEDVAALVEHGAVRALNEALSLPSSVAVGFALKATLEVLGLDRSAETATRRSTFASLYHECGGVELIQALMLDTDDDDSFELARHILETFFGGEDF